MGLPRSLVSFQGWIIFSCILFVIHLGCFYLLLLLTWYEQSCTSFLYGCRFLILFIYLAVLGLKLGLHLEPLRQPYFCDFFFFQDRVSWTICHGWLQTSILLISASWVARITGVGHWCPARFFIFYLFFQCLEWSPGSGACLACPMPLSHTPSLL
jgi:hypothetical protein